MKKPTVIFFAAITFLLGGVLGAWGISKFLGRFNLDSLVGSKSADASLTTRTLELIREGNTTGAVELLEVRLDGSLSVMGMLMSDAPISRWDPLDVKTLQRAKDYRAKFPRTNEAFQIAVDKAFRLLNSSK